MSEEPTFYLDRALGAKTFPDVLENAGIQIVRHADVFAQDARDVDWIPVVATQGWYALTQDKRIWKNQVERETVIASGLGFFYLTGANSAMGEIARNFVASHAAVLRFIARTERPFIAAVQRGQAGKPGRVEKRWPKT